MDAEALQDLLGSTITVKEFIIVTHVDTGAMGSTLEGSELTLSRRAIRKDNIVTVEEGSRMNPITDIGVCIADQIFSVPVTDSFESIMSELDG